MLDDLKYIHQLDKDDALGVTEHQYRQLQHIFEIPEINGLFENVVVAGMGGSGLAALLSTVWPGYKVPFEINRGYTIPTYVSEKTLFIASSYSGNTEETLEAYARAEEKGACIAVITSGGKLAQLAQSKNRPLVKLPAGVQPRFGVFYALNALVDILSAAGLTDGKKNHQELDQVANFIKQASANWLADIPTSKNPAKKLALELAGKSPVIYAGPLLYPAAYKWKTNINETSKNVAWCNQLPEFNHNEFLGWTSHPTDKPYAVVDLRSSFDHSRVQKRFEVTAKLLSGRRPAPHTVTAEGDTPLKQLIWAIVFGDFTSIYLAFLNGVDPYPVELVEKFKKELG